MATLTASAASRRRTGGRSRVAAASVYGGSWSSATGHPHARERERWGAGRGRRARRRPGHGDGHLDAERRSCAVGRTLWNDGTIDWLDGQFLLVQRSPRPSGNPRAEHRRLNAATIATTCCYGSVFTVVPVLGVRQHGEGGDDSGGPRRSQQCGSRELRVATLCTVQLGSTGSAAGPDRCWRWNRRLWDSC